MTARPWHVVRYPDRNVSLPVVTEKPANATVFQAVPDLHSDCGRRAPDVPSPPQTNDVPSPVMSTLTRQLGSQPNGVLWSPPGSPVGTRVVGRLLLSRSPSGREMSSTRTASSYGDAPAVSAAPAKPSEWLSTQATPVLGSAPPSPPLMIAQLARPGGVVQVRSTAPVATEYTVSACFALVVSAVQGAVPTASIAASGDSAIARISVPTGVAGIGSLVIVSRAWEPVPVTRTRYQVLDRPPELNAP